jgi:hypothetical protein
MKTSRTRKRSRRLWSFTSAATLSRTQISRYTVYAVTQNHNDMSCPISNFTLTQKAHRFLTKFNSHLLNLSHVGIFHIFSRQPYQYIYYILKSDTRFGFIYMPSSVIFWWWFIDKAKTCSTFLMCNKDTDMLDGTKHEIFLEMQQDNRMVFLTKCDP